MQVHPTLSPINTSFCSAQQDSFSPITPESINISEVFFCKDQYQLIFAGGGKPDLSLNLSSRSDSKNSRERLPRASFSPPSSRSPPIENLHYTHIQTKDNVKLLRSTFVLVFASSMGLTLYAYNWKKGLLDNFRVSFSKLKSWSTFRQHLLRGILAQKMGLFYHLPVLVSSRGASEIDLKMETVELLALNSSPSLLFSQAQKHKDSPTNQPVISFAQVLQNARPKVPLQKTKDFSQFSDPVSQQGIQFKKVAEGFAAQKERKNLIQNVYDIWAGFRACPPRAKLEYQMIEVIARSSRLIYCSRLPFFFEKGPLLFTSLQTPSRSIPLYSFKILSESETNENFQKESISSFLDFLSQSVTNHGFLPVRVTRSLLQLNVRHSNLFFIKFVELSRPSSKKYSKSHFMVDCFFSKLDTTPRMVLCLWIFMHFTPKERLNLCRSRPQEMIIRIVLMLCSLFMKGWL